DGAIARLIICRLTRFHRRSPHSICERFKMSLTASPCITRGRGGWLGLTPWKTLTSYPLPTKLAHTALGQKFACRRRCLGGRSPLCGGFFVNRLSLRFLIYHMSFLDRSR